MLLTSQSTRPLPLAPLPARCVNLAGVPRAAAGRPARPVAIQSSSSSSEADLAATPASKCPFAGSATSSSTTVPQPAAQQQQVAALSGPGWRVLPPGESSASSSLPQPQGHRSWVPLLGDVLEFERLGAGAFMLQRYRQFGPVFTWQLGGDRLVSVVEYETVKSLLQNGDSKVMSGWNPEALYAMLGEGARQPGEPGQPAAVAKDDGARVCQGGTAGLPDKAGGHLREPVGGVGGVRPAC